jgi:hypothetical protein
MAGGYLINQLYPVKLQIKTQLHYTYFSLRVLLTGRKYKNTNLCGENNLWITATNFTVINKKSILVKLYDRSKLGRTKEMHAEFRWWNLLQNAPLEEQEGNGRVTITEIGCGNGRWVKWLRITYNSGLWYLLCWNFRFYYKKVLIKKEMCTETSWKARP